MFGFLRRTPSAAHQHLLRQMDILERCLGSLDPASPGARALCAHITTAVRSAGMSAAEAAAAFRACVAAAQRRRP